MSDWGAYSSGVADVLYANEITSEAFWIGYGVEPNNVKGNWAEVAAATARDYNELLIYATYNSDGTAMVDFAVGAAGSEIVFVENLWFTAAGTGGTSHGYGLYRLPVRVPAGSRLAARMQRTDGGGPILGLVGMDSRCLLAGSRVVSLGANLSTTMGVTVDPGGTANVKGAWAELTAATPVDLKGVMVVVRDMGRTAISADARMLVDVGAGVAGSETAILGNLPAAMGATTWQVVPGYFPFVPVGVSAGERLSVRAQSSLAVSGEREISAVVYGVTA